MDNKIHLEFSKTGALKKGALILALCAFFALLLALLPLISTSEGTYRERISALADSYRALPDDPQELRQKLREIEGELLEIAQESHNPLIKASAFADAGIVALRAYQEAVEVHEASSISIESDKPSSTRLDTAAEYLREAARICVDQGDHTSCAWGKIQRNLDAVHFLLEQDARTKIDPGTADSEEKASADASGGNKRDQNLSRQTGEGPLDDPLSGPRPEEGIGAGETGPGFKGSVRGALSQELQDPYDVDGLEGSGNPQEGGAGRSRPNLP